MTRDDIFQVIVDSTRNVMMGLDDHAFTATDTLEGLGANSVDRAEIVMMTLEAIDLKIPLIKTVGPRNMGELAELLYDKLSLR